MESNGFGEIYPLSNWGVVDSENGFGIVYRGLVYNEVYFNFNITNILLELTTLTATLTVDWGETLGYDENKNIEGRIVFKEYNESFYSNFVIERNTISNSTSVIIPLIFTVPSQLGDYEFELELTRPTHNPFINPNPLVNDIWIFNQPQWQ